MSCAQTTLAQPFTISGVGLHTGEDCRATVAPASAGEGVTFIRDGARVPAVASAVSDTRRCTCLQAGGVSVSTVEHLLSALAGCGIDNADIVLDGPEIPILDGSASQWVAAITAAGAAPLDRPALVRRASRPVAIHVGASWIVALPSTGLRLTVVTDFGHPMLGAQIDTCLLSPSAYAEQIAPARTFGFIEEVEALLRNGLARGGSLDNALIVYPDRFSDDLRVPNECLRHKMLDLIGDLALVGGRLQAHVIAVRPGHLANVALAAALADQPKETAGCTI